MRPRLLPPARVVSPAGRDLIGVARTGSGKTLAYLLPCVRHVAAQPPVADGEGPIALIMAPSRELVSQVRPGERMRMGGEASAMKS